MNFGIIILKIGVHFGISVFTTFADESPHVANHYARRYANSYFWRTSQQQIDYIEESDGQFSLFEMKWNPKRANTQFPKTFISTYDVREKAIVTPENWLEWVTR